MSFNLKTAVVSVTPYINGYKCGTSTYTVVVLALLAYYMKQRRVIGRNDPV